MSYFPRDTAPVNGSTNVVESNGIFDELALKAPLGSPTFTGTVTAAKINATGIRDYNGQLDITTTQSYSIFPGQTLRLNYVSGVTLSLLQDNLGNGDICYVSIYANCPACYLSFVDAFGISTTLTITPSTRVHIMLRKLPSGLQYFGNI